MESTAAIRRKKEQEHSILRTADMREKDRLASIPRYKKVALTPGFFFLFIPNDVFNLRKIDLD